MHQPTIQLVREFAFKLLDEQYAAQPLGKHRLWAALVGPEFGRAWLKELCPELGPSRTDWRHTWGLTDGPNGPEAYVWRSGWELSFRTFNSVFELELFLERDIAEWVPNQLTHIFVDSKIMPNVRQGTCLALYPSTGVQLNDSK